MCASSYKLSSLFVAYVYGFVGLLHFLLYNVCL